jgi:outer membrane protein OmpA-like peptidoglycan-associated protein
MILKIILKILFLIYFQMFLASFASCSVPAKKAIIDKLTGCPPYEDEVAFPTEKTYIDIANNTPEIEPDYLDKMYKKIQDDFTNAGIDLEEITNGFKAKGIIIEREMGSNGFTKELRISLDGDIAFASGSAQLTPKARELVSKLGDALNEYLNTLAKIEGHTDSDGAAIYNQRLSQQRAQAVKTELITVKKISSGRIIKVTGYGADKPIVPNTTPEGKAKNRRVEIKIIPGSPPATGIFSENYRYRSCA